MTTAPGATLSAIVPGAQSFAEEKISQSILRIQKGAYLENPYLERDLNISSLKPIAEQVGYDKHDIEKVYVSRQLGGTSEIEFVVNLGNQVLWNPTACLYLVLDIGVVNDASADTLTGKRACFIPGFARQFLGGLEISMGNGKEKILEASDKPHALAEWMVTMVDAGYPCLENDGEVLDTLRRLEGSEKFPFAYGDKLITTEDDHPVRGPFKKKYPLQKGLSYKAGFLIMWSRFYSMFASGITPPYQDMKWHFKPLSDTRQLFYLHDPTAAGGGDIRADTVTISIDTANTYFRLEKFTLESQVALRLLNYKIGLMLKYMIDTYLITDKHYPAGSTNMVTKLTATTKAPILVISGYRRDVLPTSGPELYYNFVDDTITHHSSRITAVDTHETEETIKEYDRGLNGWVVNSNHPTKHGGYCSGVSHPERVLFLMYHGKNFRSPGAYVGNNFADEIFKKEDSLMLRIFTGMGTGQALKGTEYLEKEGPSVITAKSNLGTSTDLNFIACAYHRRILSISATGDVAVKDPTDYYITPM